MFYDTLRPRPVPLPTGLVVKKGSKIFRRFSYSMRYLIISACHLLRKVRTYTNATIMPEQHGIKKFFKWTEYLTGVAKKKLLRNSG